MSLSPSLRGVLFDLDGTLVDTYDLILTSFRCATREVLGKVIPDEQLMAKVGQPLDTQMWDFTDSPAVHERLRTVYRAHNARVHDELAKAFPGVPEALDELAAAGLAIGIVTSKRHEPALRALDRFDLTRRVAFVVGSDDWPAHKPDPGSVLHGCDLLGLAPQECAYVGDSPFDLQAGRAAGCLTVAALWGMFDRDTLLAERPDCACESMADAVRALLGGRLPA